MKEFILGIDPGLTGGLAFISRDGLLIEPIPRIGGNGDIDIYELTRLISDYSKDVQHAFVENVHAMPKNGSIGNFKLGRCFGIIQGLLIVFDIGFTAVAPSRWMKEMHQGISKDLPTKQRSATAFRRIFPKINALENKRCRVPHMGMVEAALIAEYGRRTIGKAI